MRRGWRRACPLYPESGHVQCNSACLLCANSGHRADHDALQRAVNEIADEEINIARTTGTVEFVDGLRDEFKRNLAGA